MHRSRRAAFTLIELLVVIGIILLLSGFTLAVINTTINSDRIRSASRGVQAYVAGARDRAAQAKDFRGLRLLPDPGNVNLVSSIQYIKPVSISSYGRGTVTLARLDANTDTIADGPDIVIVRGLKPDGTSVDWNSLASQGLFSTPPRIRIPSITTTTQGRWYSFSLIAPDPGEPLATRLQLTSPYTGMGTMAAHPAVIAHDRTANDEATSCDLEMANQLLENSQPLLLPRGAVINLARSGNIPTDWTSAPNFRDIMFSPRGSITGPLGAGGPIYLYIAERNDAEQNLDPVVSKGEKLILAIYPQTGNVSTFNVDTTDADNNNIADDPFLQAKKGVVAGQ